MKCCMHLTSPAPHERAQASSVDDWLASNCHILRPPSKTTGLVWGGCDFCHFPLQAGKQVKAVCFQSKAYGGQRERERENYAEKGEITFLHT